MLTFVCVLSLGAVLAGEDAAARLKSMCEKYVTAPSVTFEVSLFITVEMAKEETGGKEQAGGEEKVRKRPFVKGPAGKPKDDKLVVRREAGKPEHMTFEDAELFRFENGALVGRIAGGAWRRIVDTPKPDLPGNRHFSSTGSSTALDRLVYAASLLPSPVAWLKRVRDEFESAEEKESADGTKLEAWLNGNGPGRPTVSRAEANSPGGGAAQDTNLVAHLTPDGAVRKFTISRASKSAMPSADGFSGFSRHTLTPSAVGQTRVEVPPEVAALAAG